MKKYLCYALVCLLSVLMTASLTAHSVLTVSAITPKSQKGGIELNPDKTNLPQPAELIAGDHAFVSDLYWIHNQGYSGGSAMRDTNCAGEYIWSCDLKRWKKGIGIHAASSSYNAYVDVNIENIGYTKFATWYGVCETLSGNDISMCNIKFAVFGDGIKLFESGTMRYGQPFEYAEVDVTGVKTLRLAIAGAPGIAGAWGIWGGAVLSKSGDVSEIVFYRELVIENPTPETEAPTEEATNPVTEPVSEPVSEPATDAPTDTIPETATSTEPNTETNASTDTEAVGNGCKATLAGAAILLTVTTAFALTNRKEEETC